MTITKSTTLSEIQDVFHVVFPHLKIAFYASPHASGEGSGAREQLADTKTVGQLTDLREPVAIDLDGDMKISTFEQEMVKRCGLNVQVFRRSANLWLQTTRTDNWTLHEANRKGGHSRDLYKDQHR